MFKRIIKRTVVAALSLSMVLSASAGLTIKSNVKAAELPVGDQELTNEFGVTLPDNYYQRKVVGYFPNYAINLDAHKKFDITQLQWDKLTHVQYAFVVADPNTFEIVPSDMENDVQSEFEDREFYHDGQKIEMDPTLDYKGQFNLMHTMKEMHPDVTVLASTGGWAASKSLWLVTDNEQNMTAFANSAVDFIREYGFDGIDIDFEFPSETSLSGNPDDFTISEPRRAGISDRYTRFLEILREKLTAAALEDGTYYWLTSAVSASSWVLGGQTNSDFLDYLDFVSIMSYDYHGGWNNFVENQANLYADPADRETASMAQPTLGFDWSKNFYRGAVQSEKILMGVPYYTRGWTNVSGGTNGLHGSSNTPATGNENIWHDKDGSGREVAAGANPLWHVKNLMKNDSNYQRFWDPVGKVPYIWNNVNRTFMTFEDEQSIQERIDMVEENNLGGVLIWVMHGDYDYDAVNDEYTVGDTLTTMLHDQFAAMPDAKMTTDLDLDAETANFDVDFTGHYDHPNYYYTISLTNNTGEALTGYTLSFDMPKSAIFSANYGGTTEVTDAEDPAFKTVTITGPLWQSLADGATAELTGSIKLNFAGVKNFRLNGKAMYAEVVDEIERLRDMGLTVADANVPDSGTGVDDPGDGVDDPGTGGDDPGTGGDDPGSDLEDTYDNSVAYNAGDIVILDGITYRAKWWTMGTAPNPNDPWGPWEVVL